MTGFTGEGDSSIFKYTVVIQCEKRKLKILRNICDLMSIDKLWQIGPCFTFKLKKIQDRADNFRSEFQPRAVSNGKVINHLRNSIYNGNTNRP